MVAGSAGTRNIQNNPFQLSFSAELTDVLRKRRNRPDASDEDLGLPRSPASPQRHAGAGQSRKAAGYQPRSVAQGHEVSSLSLLSVNSTDGEDSQSHRQHSSKSISSSEQISSVVLRDHQEDDVDAVGLERHRLSHAAAKHKMAIRPAKKKGPTRQHRRTLETSIPEANEELIKMGQTQALNPILRAVKDTDQKTKTRSLPPGSSLAATTTATAANPTSNSYMRTKTIEHKSSTITGTSSSSERTTTTSSQPFGLRALTFKAANALFDGRGESSTDGDDVTTGTAESSDHGFLRRLMQRNSKRSIARANDGLEDLDTSQNLAKKLQISTSCLEAATRDPVPLPNKSRSATSHEQHIQETRQIIKREIHNEGKHGLNAMVSNFGVHPQPPTAVKPKSGPAARQRYLPKELGAPLDKPLAHDSDITNLLSKSSRGNDTFQSTALVREQAQIKTETSLTTSHFERKPRIVGLSAFQQKLSRSSDSMGQHSSSSNSLETSTDEPSPLYYEEKQRKTVEKSRSFRNYQEERDVVTESASMHSNMPSLPDLSLSFRVPPSYYKQKRSPQSPRSPMSPGAKCVSLGFEINDNNKLLQAHAESTGKLQGLPTKVSTQAQRNSAQLASSPGAANISQMEPNIDLIAKSPMVSVLRKSGTVGEHLGPEQQQQAPQRPKVLELKQTTTIAIGSPNKDAATASPLAKSAKLSNSPPSTPSKFGQPVSGPAQPEFMKIQLNRVDQARIHNKTNHLVLAKNVKPAASPAERSQSSDDLTMRRLSGESTGSIQIVERSQKPPSATSPLQPHSISQPAEVLAKQQRAVSANSLRSSYISSSSGSSCSGGSSEVLVSASPATTPNTPKSGSSRPVETVEPASGHDKASVNRLSLEERKRLFLNEEKCQAERKLAEMRYERKKSINEELQRKPETTPSPGATAPSSPLTPSGSDANNGHSGANVVVLRKKSFPSASGNGNSNGNASEKSSGQEDATPELMKVFARRSLKVKDDDVVTLTQVAVASHKKVTNGSQSVDSDKENQSNSEEKLDKLTASNEPAKHNAQSNSNSNSQGHAHAHGHSHAQPSSNNRSSVADFRNLNNNVQPVQQKLSNLPPIKVTNARNATVHNNNKSINKSNNNNNNSSAMPTNERYSLQLKPATTTAATVAATTATIADAAAAAGAAGALEPGATPTKQVERSATVGEFKGIHQRRAEWEQRVKEALK
ncbi:streptococcal hemagglutinin isoform X3 [Drosophila virilis]|uniref:streptococcal hemagglutinin isoform X3 n=1 Tax=Drosophila virilis TaxID=7244 RepID=UPI0013963778|nr:uncharacterized protein LOC6626684 isoform X3 [Drosophila virilis]